MKTRKEIITKIIELTPGFELAEEAYFSAVEEKQKRKEYSQIDFLKLESEYEILKEKIKILRWIIYSKNKKKEKLQHESSNNNQKRKRPSNIL